MLELRDAQIRLSSGRYRYTLCVAPGEIVAVLGPSGSGKSTMLNLIGGFAAVSGGDILWSGRSLLPLAPDQRPVTTLFQHHNLFDHLSVWKNVALGFDPGAKLDSAQQQQLRDALGSVGLHGFESRMPGELSGGEQQRVALARTLASRKLVLLLDEPYSALDTDLRQQMLLLTSSIVASARLATILVTHDPADAAVLGARVVRLRDGRLYTE